MKKDRVLSAVESAFNEYQLLISQLEGSDNEAASAEIDKFCINSMRSILGTYYIAKSN